MTAKVSNHGAFLHIPKTGGIWVQYVLEAAGVFGRGIGHEHNWEHREKWAFTIVREPTAWWLSLWRHRMDTGWPEFSGDHPLAPLNHLKETDPAIFLLTAARDYAGFCGELFKAYTRNANYILQTEQLKTQLVLLARNVGWPKLPVDMPPENVSQRKVDASSLDLSPLHASERIARSIWDRAGLEPASNFSI